MLRMFEVKQGDEFSFTITFKNLQQDLTALDMGVKKDYTNKHMLITKGLGNGVEKISAGKYRVDFMPEETKALKPDLYVYDLRMRIGSIKYTPLYGYLNIEETVFE